MRKLTLSLLLTAAGCSQGLIGEPESRSNIETVLFTGLELSGSSSVARTVLAGDRADDDGSADQLWRLAWTLGECDGCLPADTGEARTHVFRIRATDDTGVDVYKKVTITLHP